MLRNEINTRPTQDKTGVEKKLKFLKNLKLLYLQ